LLLVLLPISVLADDNITIAVASNFASTAQELTQHFTAETDIDVRLSYGSTGKLYAQIINGAPFDVLLAADAERPRLLEASGHGVPGSRATYAIGALVLWSRDPRAQGDDCRDLLAQGNFDHLALANPATAPYGKAARESLEAMGLWDRVEKRAVYGESIAQTLQFVATGNATLGFVAMSQLASPGLPDATCSWPVPRGLHGLLRQQRVLLARSENSDAARQFIKFIDTAAAREIIVRHGYGVAEQ
jgi:molybdate transport system substrate-binding protein